MFLPEIRFCGPDDVPAIIEANGLSLYPWPDVVIARDLAASSPSEQPWEGLSYLGAFSRGAAPDPEGWGGQRSRPRPVRGAVLSAGGDARPLLFGWRERGGDGTSPAPRPLSGPLEGGIG